MLVFYTIKEKRKRKGKIVVGILRSGLPITFSIQPPNKKGIEITLEIRTQISQGHKLDKKEETCKQRKPYLSQKGCHCQVLLKSYVKPYKQ